MTRLALLIMDYCSTNHISESMLAALINVQHSHLSEYKLMRRAIPFHTMRALCDTLQCQPNDLLGYTTDADIIALDDADMEDAR